MGSLAEHFAALADPRVERAKRYSLLSIVTIALCGVIRGAQSWVEIAAFGRAKADWFATFLDLPAASPRMTRSDAFSHAWMHSSLRPACTTGWRQWRTRYQWRGTMAAKRMRGAARPSDRA